jgi:hypothetical protein
MVWACEAGDWPWPTSVGVDGQILFGNGCPNGLWCYVISGVLCGGVRIRKRANHRWIGILLAGTERILLCLRHIGLRPDRAGFLRT